MGFIAELRCRNVIRVAGLQLAGAWLLTEVAGTLLPVFGAPDWAVQAAATSHQFPAAGRAKSHGSWPLRIGRPFRPRRRGGGRSRRRSGRRAGCGPVVRLLQRTALLEVGQDGADGGRSLCRIQWLHLQMTAFSFWLCI